MGLDASVMCNCFRDGRATPPPFPLEWLEVDVEGYLNLKQGHDTDENWLSQYEWEQSCCEHEGMAFASEHISNWPGYRLFQAALGEVGWEYFPVLKEQLPNVNGGLTPASESTKACDELNTFVTAGEIGKRTVLVNTASGEATYEHVAAYEGVFIHSGARGIDVGLSEREFFAIKATSREFLFRAIRFRQFNRTGDPIAGDSSNIVWENLDTGEIYESGVAVSGKQITWDDGSWESSDGRCRFEYPAEFHVEQRPRFTGDFDHILKALRTVFAASVTTGNPVRWG